MLEYPQLTLTMTTGKRLGLFYATIKSFFDTCQDLDLITRFIISDDGSNEREFKLMQDICPKFEVYRSPMHGQQNSLNFLFGLVKTDWAIHIEDDWLFLKKDNYIRKMFDVVNSNPKIKNVTLRNWVGDVRQLDNGVQYNIHHFTPGKGDMKTTNCQWFGYSLNPGLQYKPLIDSFGPYPSNFDGKGEYARYWDRVHAQKYLDQGYLAANLVGEFMEHVGWETSRYDI